MHFPFWSESHDDLGYFIFQCVPGFQLSDIPASVWPTDERASSASSTSNTSNSSGSNSSDTDGTTRILQISITMDSDNKVDIKACVF